MTESRTFTISLAFENVALPPFQDILIITAKAPHGKIGITGSLNLLQPDRFEILELHEELVELLIVNKRIFKRIPQESLIDVLRKRVFPYIDKGEIVKVDFKVHISYDNLKVEVVTDNEG